MRLAAYGSVISMRQKHNHISSSHIDKYHVDQAYGTGYRRSDKIDRQCANVVIQSRSIHSSLPDSIDKQLAETKGKKKKENPPDIFGLHWGASLAYRTTTKKS